MKLPHQISYTHAVKAGDQFMWRIRINPKYKNDKGLLAHEYEHVKQWYKMTALCLGLLFIPFIFVSTDYWLLSPLCAILHGFLYAQSTAYRAHCEAEAFKKQMEYNSGQLDYFADSLASYYDLSITIAQAKRLLKS